MFGVEKAASEVSTECVAPGDRLGGLAQTTKGLGLWFRVEGWEDGAAGMEYPCKG